VAGLGPLQSILALYGRIRTTGASQRSDSTFRHLGRGGLPQRVTVEGQPDYPLSLHRRLPKSVSTPITDAFAARSHTRCYA
jgi:hypothetical protein